MESFSNAQLDDNRCFLCGTLINKSNRSEEHVLPKWILNEFNLWDEKISLLNDTLIPYRQLVIPSCKECNNSFLSQLETDIKGILLQEFRNLSPKEENRLFQWCSKLLFGLLYKEMSLRFDRRDEAQGTITNKGFLEDFSTFHHFMTSIRRNFEFVEFTPYSVFVSEIAVASETSVNFDYCDFIAITQAAEAYSSLGLAIRVQEFGIICIFQDNGHLKEHFQPQFDRFKDIPLHPMQFLELACRAFYKHTIRTFNATYHSFATKDPNSKVTVFRADGPNGAIWQDWSNAEYTRLAYPLFEERVKAFPEFKIPTFDNFCGDNFLASWLKDELGNPRKIPI